MRTRYEPVPFSWRPRSCSAPAWRSARPWRATRPPGAPERTSERSGRFRRPRFPARWRLPLPRH